MLQHCQYEQLRQPKRNGFTIHGQACETSCTPRPSLPLSCQLHVYIIQINILCFLWQCRVLLSLRLCECGACAFCAAKRDDPIRGEVVPQDRWI